MNTQRKTILIVDDDEQVLISLEHFLEDQGYHTTTAWGGEEALRLLQSRSFDFVLLDHDLPGLRREELIRHTAHATHWILLQPNTRFRPVAVSGSPADAVCKWEHGAILSKLRDSLSAPQQLSSERRSRTLA
jgi:CheY-like chemotaxis protein